MKKRNDYTIFDTFVVARFTNCDEHFLCDIEDWERLKRFAWLKDDRGYPMHRFNVDGEWKNIRMHDMILNVPQGYVVDHSNRDKRDCRKTNLRLVTSAENARNKVLSTRNKTGVEGVCRDKRSGKYRAYIRCEGKHKSLGWYNTLAEAAEARMMAERALGYGGQGNMAFICEMMKWSDANERVCNEIAAAP